MFAAYSEECETELSVRRNTAACEEGSRSSDKWLSNSSFPSSSNQYSKSEEFSSVSDTRSSDTNQTSKSKYVEQDCGQIPVKGRLDVIDVSSHSDSISNISSDNDTHASEDVLLEKESERTRSQRTRRKSNLRKQKKERSRKRSRSPNKERYSSKRNKYKGAGRKHRSTSSESASSVDTDSTKSSRCRKDQASTKTFYEDRDRDFGNMKVPTLSRPSIAWYHSSKLVLGDVKRCIKIVSKKKTLKYRYYNRILKSLAEELETLDSNQIKKSVVGTTGTALTTDSYHLEEELSKMTEKFNRDLTSEPGNVALWLKYVEFQDSIHQFELAHRRGGGAAGRRVMAERKLSILDKALEANPDSLNLLKERCQLAESVLPGDKLSLQLKAWVTKDPSNLILWKSLIMASQGSLSTCSVPVVKSLYQEALKSIHGLFRGGGENVVLLESKIIDLILHLGLFLRQSGLMELMWSLFHVYLEFNLAKLDSSKFNISSTIADNALIELEESILESQMPLPTLWLRIETLRSGTHWVSLPADSDCEDPQRIVFPDDVNDFIHPISTPNMIFRLVTVTLILLKVPLLPWRQNAAEAAGLEPLPWLLDGPEPLYASLFPLGTLEFRETSVLLSDAAQLAHGPQFLIARPGQDEYIDFLTQVFSACSECLASSHRTYVQVWWLRFYRWLIQLERLGHCKLPLNRKKKMRSKAKELLRQDCNRSNLLLFKEFALLEWECGSVDGARKVLQGAISAQPSSKPVPFSHERAALCALYRTFVELCLSLTNMNAPHTEQISENQVETITTEEDREKALSLLVSLGRGLPLTEKKVLSTDIASALSKFDHISRELFINPEESEGDVPVTADTCHLAPSYIVEWTACHGWLLYLSDSIWKASAMFEVALTSLKQPSTDAVGCDGVKNNLHSLLKVLREGVFETYVSLLRHHCHVTYGSFGTLRDVVLRGLMEFPGNLTLLSAFSDFESSVSGTGMPSWRLSKTFIDFNSVTACALLVFVMRHRLKQQGALRRNSDIFLHRGGPDVSNSFLRTRMDTVLKRLTKHPVMRRSPLLWRLRLQFAAAFSNKDSDCHSTFYLALEDCPWAKALYMDIVQVLPMQLGQIQDLLIEKELRLHVTPEELEILRKDS